MSPSPSAVIAGIGETAYVRGTSKTEGQLYVEAALLACRDAGIEPESIDGILVPGFRGKVEDLINGLGARDILWSERCEIGGAASAAAVAHAADLVNAGHASRVVVSTVRLGYSGGRVGAGGSDLLADFARIFPSPLIRTSLEYPYGLMVPMQYYSLHANRWIHEYSIDPSAMGEVAMSMRRNAQTNAGAYMRGRQLNREDYFGSALLCSPLRFFDCCLETDGAAAVVVTAGDVAPSRAKQVRVAAGGEGHPDSPDDIVGRPDTMQMGISKAAPRVFAQAGVGPQEMDFAELYDCFTFIVLRHLEEMGFCERGESPAFVAEKGIGNDGALPVNTHGGLLSQAHVAGMNHVVEAVKQLRGEAGEGQLARARYGVVTGYGDFGDGSMLVLTNQ